MSYVRPYTYIQMYLIIAFMNTTGMLRREIKIYYHDHNSPMEEPTMGHVSPK
jgi:hypothetical protein